MKKKQTQANIDKKPYSKNEIFVKIMAGILAVLMLAGTVITLVYALIMR